jgi:uncharacterized protein (DUF1800 family)
MKMMSKTTGQACFLLALASGLLQAQTVSVTPAGYITTGLGGIIQFHATTSDMPGGVVWSAGGKVGGNATVGKIDINGLYTAPTAMYSNAVQITAALATNTRIAGSQYVYLLSNGPVLSSVSPNPLPSGTSTVTLTGTGFLAGASVMSNGVQLSTISVTSTVVKASIWQSPTITTASFMVRNPSSVYSNTLIVPVSGTSSGGGSGGGTTNTAPVISPKNITLALGGTQQFTATGTPVPTWSAVSGTVSSAGLYTAPAVMPASGNDTVTATNVAGTSAATVTLVSNVPPTLTSIGATPLPLGVFSTTVSGTGFTSLTQAQLNNVALATTYGNANSITVTGFAGTNGTVNLTVNNGPVISQPLAVQVGVQNPQVSPAAARRFLEQAAFGPTPAEAAHVQTIGMPAWITEQLTMPAVSNYNVITSSQGSMPTTFLANAVTNPDQLRQKVAFALSQIFVTSLSKIIWNTDMIPYQHILMNDAFTNYRQILGDVTLSATMGNYLDMANNAKANPNAGTVANENYAREIMQLFSIGTKMLNSDGTVQTNANGPIPSYDQTNVTELARVFTGWTYTPLPAHSLYWGAYINTAGPMVPFSGMHDFGSKSLLNGYVAPANLSPVQDLQAALDNLATHGNVAPFISKQLIQHLVKSNPTPAYVKRVGDVFTQTNGDMSTVITTILLDQEARANDEGGNDLANDGHLQEPVLQLTGFIRAFGGTMNLQNYYASEMAARGEDIFNAASVFNYYSPGYVVGGTGGLLGPEFQINNPNGSVLRENLVGSFFNQYSNPIQSYGPGTTVDLTPFLGLANAPATLVNAVDLTLTHGVMPAAMKQIIVNAVIADTTTSLHKVQTAIYLTLTSSYYNVWH